MSTVVDQPVTGLHSMARQLAGPLRRLGITTIRELIEYYPFRYDDFSQVADLGALNPGAVSTVQGQVEKLKSYRSWKRKLLITEAVVGDGQHAITVRWFNQPFVGRVLKIGDTVSVSGKVDASGQAMAAASYEKLSQRTAVTGPTHTGRLVPVYSVTAGLTPKQLRFLIKQALLKYANLAEYLPEPLRAANNFLPFADAVQQIHFPDSLARLAQAQERLRFDEFLFIQLRNQLSRQELAGIAAPRVTFDAGVMKDFLATLPFELTQAQRRSAWEIIQDLDAGRPMNRLLDGDVGSGKTLVAAMVARQVAAAGYQVVIMAPTEILAWQHYQTLARLFAGTPVVVGVYTRTYRATSQRSAPLTKVLLLSQLRRGGIHLIVGTQALIQEGVSFHRLGLAVVDEQHRFGVDQRHALQKMSPGWSLAPHFLSMTATPIPRSLALTLYGDLDVSLLDELPAGRQPITTAVVSSAGRAKLYEQVDRELAAGRQAFVICPLIDPSDTTAAAAVTTEYERLRTDVFPRRRVGLLHGKLKPAEKDRVMATFVAGEIDILVATSVIEVGVDVPNATMMLIEGAERFGLAQLHQFRGRVGRGKYQSYCWLLTERDDGAAAERLTALVNNRDGFALAEQDLKLRGPGDILGSSQSGWPELKFATLFDLKNIKRARTAATKLLAADPELINHPQLKERVGRWGKIHWE